MNHLPESPTPVVSPDTRAYAALLAVFSPLLLLYGLVWIKRGSLSPWISFLIIGLVISALVQLRNRTVTLGDEEIRQGIRPLGRRMAYRDIKQIHHIYITSRYGGSSCLVVSGTQRRDIVLPMRSFSRNKRVRLVQLLQAKAPQARVDPTVLHG